MSKTKNLPVAARRSPITAFDESFHDLFAGKLLFDRLGEEDLNPLRIEEFVEDGTRVIRAEAPGLDPEKDVDVDVTDTCSRNGHWATFAGIGRPAQLCATSTTTCLIFCVLSSIVNARKGNWSRTPMAKVHWPSKDPANRTARRLFQPANCAAE